jgi:phosphoserine phosphatase RsbU/P
MENHNDKYFTIWYGVYNRKQRRLIYTNAGHPPALLLSHKSEQDIVVEKLESISCPIGFLAEDEFEDNTVEIKENSTLYIFSNGVYEIPTPDGKIWGLNALIDLLTHYTKRNTCYLDQVLAEIHSVSDRTKFDDDLSILKVSF